VKSCRQKTLKSLSISGCHSCQQQLSKDSQRHQQKQLQAKSVAAAVAAAQAVVPLTTAQSAKCQLQAAA